MSTSTIPAVKDALVARLRAHPTLAGVQVERSHPGDTLEQEAVWLGRVIGSNSWVAMRAGRKPRDESYTVQVFIEVIMPGEPETAAEDRVLACYGALEDVIAEDPRLGVTGVESMRVAEYELDSGIDGEGAGAANMAAGVLVGARLS